MGFKIIGSYIDYEYGYGGYTGNKTAVDEIVATFDTEKDAELYIRKSRLKNPTNRERPFKKKSLLSNFQYANVEVIGHDDDPPPHNPKM
jgi:hypothetical protein